MPASVTVHWASVPDSGYWVCWDTTNNNSCDSMWWPNGAMTSKLLEGLSPATYYWQVRADTPGGTVDADGGQWWSFTVGGGSSGFSKLAPAPGLTGLSTNVLTEWTAVPGEGYWVCWDTVDNGACDTMWYPNGASTSKVLEGLAPGIYYWQVKTSDSGQHANGGLWWAFAVGTPEIQFGKQAPGHGAILTANATTLTWTAVQGASFYETCMDTIDNGVCDTMWTPAGQSLTRGIAGLTDGVYYWQVRATTAGGSAYADLGAWWKITVDAPDPIREYIYLGSKLLATITLSTGAPVTSFYHTDALGSVRAITDAAGATVARHDYFPFGESTSPLTGDPRKFTGKERDAETAFDYFEARYYRNLWGRFTTVDPLPLPGKAGLFPQRFNMFSYALNNPLRFVDPSGMVIDDSRLSDGDKKIWAEIVALATSIGSDGKPLHPELYSLYRSLQDDQRVFYITMVAANAQGTAGRFDVTVKTDSDFSKADIFLNKKLLRSIEKNLHGDFPGLTNYADFARRMAQVFGHEASHARDAQRRPAEFMAVMRELADARKAYQAWRNAGGKGPVPPEIMARLNAAQSAFDRLEAVGKSGGDLVNAELVASKRKR